MPRAVITLHDDIEQGSEKWLRFREGMYTGSNAWKLLNGLNDLEYAIAEESTFSGNFWTKRGHALEDQAADLYEKITGTKMHHTGLVTNSLYPKCLYSPDGLPPDILWENKSFDKKNHLQLMKVKTQWDVPLKILAQVHYGMLITNRKLAHLTPYNPVFAKKVLVDPYGHEYENPDYDPKLAFRIITIRYDREIANNFKRILTGVPV